ncbi:uncharacterized protein N7500_004714 [Penicillium coprophilum]|uniref:uncharacterized protein n=1 Tax=Penicillium coprophilum TaxID=36646 RepID=UPI0023879193|nr:uncharacterized protein N7500_004714 [Penicillium coprophilum]KAJ5162884.1 hypothetical protein N7500_004714 [Penicillium coprophilum]
MESGSVWHRAKYVFSSQRYHGVPSNQPEKAILHWSNRIESQENIEASAEAEVTKHDSSRPQKPQWINGVLLCAKATTVLLLLNLTFIAVAAGLASRNSENSGFSSVHVMYQGSCILSKRWNIALHLIINIISTGILGASNYCMQSLVAPSREEVDKYHAQGRWLDIGCSSVRNLFVIGRSRLALWLLLLITGTPFHLLYNSMVFEAMAVNEFRVVMGPGDLDSSNIASLKTPALDQCFIISPTLRSEEDPAYHGLYSDVDARDSNPELEHGWYSESDLSWHDFAADIERGNYDRLDTQQCIDIDIYNSGNATILWTSLADSIYSGGGHSNEVHGSAFAGKTLMINILDSGRANYYTNDNFTAEACLDTLDTASCDDADLLLKWANYDEDQPTLESVDRYIQVNTTSNIMASGYVITCNPTNRSGRYNIDGCLVIKSEERCQLLYSPPICIIIALTTSLKVLAMVLAARIGRYRSPPLLTVGDAVASFMEKPDSTTEGMCWLSNADVRRGAWKVPQKTEDPDAETLERADQRVPMEYRRLSQRKHWLQASSPIRWITTLALCSACIAAGAILFGKAIAPLGERWLTPEILQEIWQKGFSGARDHTDLVDLKRTLSTLSSVVMANIPQLVITVSYFFYNSVLTSMLATAEYSSYGASSKPLRVTWPIKDSMQQSTYWLSMPYQYGVPLMVAYMILHWLISQSIFYARVTMYDWVGREIQGFSINSLSHKPLAIFISILTGALMVCMLLGLSVRKFKSEMPLAGACSAAISAACHLPKDEDLGHAARGSVTWGETVASPSWAGDFGGIEDDKGHCSFTSLETVKPSLSKMYA